MLFSAAIHEAISDLGPGLWDDATWSRLLQDDDLGTAVECIFELLNRIPTDKFFGACQAAQMAMQRHKSLTEVLNPCEPEPGYEKNIERYGELLHRLAGLREILQEVQNGKSV